MKRATLLGCIAVFGLAGCFGPGNNRELTGAAIGGGVGLLTAAAFDANAGWTVLSGLAGATAGTLIARNSRNNQCAYANGDGTYRTGPC